MLDGVAIGYLLKFAGVVVPAEQGLDLARGADFLDDGEGEGRVVSANLLPGKIFALADAAADDRGENIERLAGEAARITGLDRIQAGFISQAPSPDLLRGQTEIGRLGGVGLSGGSYVGGQCAFPPGYGVK